MVQLDLIEFADFEHPHEIVPEIFRQNPELGFPVPLEAIARAAGIIEIRYQTLDAFEGVLAANAEKTQGAIAINSKSWPQRQRFTIGHELGHFMLPRHNHFMECSTSDMKNHSGLDPIEAEANAFSAQLLMPEPLFSCHPDYPEFPDCRALFSLAEHCDVSFKACVYRYQDVSEHLLGTVFSHNGLISSVRRNQIPGFWLRLGSGSVLPEHLGQKLKRMASNSVCKQVSATNLWFDTSRVKDPPDTVLEETFLQENGYATTLIWIE